MPSEFYHSMSGYKQPKGRARARACVCGWVRLENLYDAVKSSTQKLISTHAARNVLELTGGEKRKTMTRMRDKIHAFFST